MRKGGLTMAFEVRDAKLFEYLSVVVKDGVEKVKKANEERKYYRPRVWKYPKLSYFPSGIPNIGEIHQEDKKPIDYVCFVLHLGRKLHKHKAKIMQKEIANILQKKYEESDRVKLTPGEVYIRLEWVDNFEQIITTIDEAYYLRLMK
jgi:hypothetical protein